MDPVKNRAMNEKITDAIRNFFEKVTGYVSISFSQISSDQATRLAYETLRQWLMSYRKKAPAKFSN